MWYCLLCLTRWFHILRLWIQMKAIGQHLNVVLFIMLYKVVLTLKSVDETLVCDHSNGSY